MEPEYAIANPGDSVVMNCRVHNLKGKCIWQKDGKVRYIHYAFVKDIFKKRKQKMTLEDHPVR